MFTSMEKDVFIMIIITELLIIVGNGKQPIYLSKKEWLNKS